MANPPGRPQPENSTRSFSQGWRWQRTALAIFAERIAAPVTLAAVIAALFVAFGWFGLFAHIGPWLRAAITGATGIAIVGSLLPLLKARWPLEAEIRARIDATKPEAHRPLATLADTPTTPRDPFAAALWKVHQQRAAEAAARLSAGNGDAALRRKDPWALRIIAALLLVAAAFVAGDERAPRLAAGFDFTTPVTPPVPPRLDAWVDPPAYTGRPPIFLTGAVTIQPGEVLRVPVGSTLTVRSTSVVRPGEAPEAVALDIRQTGGLVEPKSEPKSDAPAEAQGDKPRAAPQDKPGVLTIRRIIAGDGTVEIMRSGREVAGFRFAVIPDLPPKASITELRPEAASTERQSPAGLRVAYMLEDDYGIAKAELVIEPLRRPGDGTTRTLYPAPQASISLRLGPGETFIPTEDHPWAGAEVSVRLRVEDDIGQKAESEAKTITLPRRPFGQPLPRALVEQRKFLVFEPDNRQIAAFAFDGLLFEPERFTPAIGDFLALDSLRTGLRNARTDDRLREIAERIYELALHLENGDMTEAERRLREAEARLREALERGAPQNEIRRLAEELRRAMDQFLREFAERALRDQNQQSMDREPSPTDRFLTQRDLQEMLRRIEEMARRGDTAEAQRLLNELRQLLENLRQAQRQNADPRMQELGRQMEELDRLQREQRDLRDRTFQQQQRRNQQGQNQQQRGQQQPGQRGRQQPGQRGQEQGEGEGDEQSLEQMQQALRDRLNQLRERLRQRGMQEGEGFGEADDGMGDAQGQLGQGRPGQATEGQQRALDGLGRAQQGMADQLQQQMGDGEGDPMGEPNGQPRGRANNSTDPLGRPQRESQINRGQEENARETLDPNNRQQLGIGERADRVLQELRKRLGEFDRPREELDYLERLLRQR
jgi:uncharacterized protein (TIGR02302 family)